MKREPKIELYRDSKREWRWRFRAVNGRIQADGAEGYHTLAGVKKGVHSVIECLSQNTFQIIVFT